MPYLVLTVQPSMSGNRSRCTPSRLTSPPPRLSLLAILSISSRNTIPFCSTACRARWRSVSSLIIRPASSSVSSLRASLIGTLRVLVFSLPILENIFCNWLVISSIPGGAIISTPTLASASSISISLASSSPSRRRLRKVCRVADGCALESSSVEPVRADGKSISRIRSSAASSARGRTACNSWSRNSLMPVSTRSRIIDSTSRPT